MREPISVDVSASHRAARVLIPLAGAGTDTTSNRALDLLREHGDPGHDRPRRRAPRRTSTGMTARARATSTTR